MRSGTTKEHKQPQIVAECESKSDSEPLCMGAERLDSRNEVIDEALAEEVRSEEQKKEEK